MGKSSRRKWIKRAEAYNSRSLIGSIILNWKQLKAIWKSRKK